MHRTQPPPDLKSRTAGAGRPASRMSSAPRSWSAIAIHLRSRLRSWFLCKSSRASQWTPGASEGRVGKPALCAAHPPWLCCSAPTEPCQSAPSALGQGQWPYAARAPPPAAPPQPPSWDHRCAPAAKSSPAHGSIEAERSPGSPRAREGRPSTRVSFRASSWRTDRGRAMGRTSCGSQTREPEPSRGRRRRRHETDNPGRSGPRHTPHPAPLNNRPACK